MATAINTAAALSSSPQAAAATRAAAVLSRLTDGGVDCEFESRRSRVDGWAFARRFEFWRSSVVNAAALRNSLPRSAAARNGAVAATCSLHTSDGGVDRNDAASTGPLLKPDPKILLEEAVRLQMDALACSDEPRPDHGLEVMYCFAITDGTVSGSSLSSYFGFPSDLYHFGHFALKFRKRCPELINHAGYELLKTETDSQDIRASVAVRAKNKNFNDSSWVFYMMRLSRGVQEPCWLTASLQRCSG